MRGGQGGVSVSGLRAGTPWLDGTRSPAFEPEYKRSVPGRRFHERKRGSQPGAKGPGQWGERGAGRGPVFRLCLPFADVLQGQRGVRWLSGARLPPGQRSGRPRRDLDFR